MNAIANAHIFLLNDFISRVFPLISSVVPLSPDAIKKLEDSRDAWQRCRAQDFADLLWMTKLVAVGVGLEVFEIAYDVIEGISRCRGKKTRDHTPLWITLAGAFGWLLIVIGVVGEFVFEAKFDRDDTEIASINQQLLGDAERTASDARTHAAELEKEAAQLQKGAEGLKKAAEAERLARVKLEALVGPRRLTVDAQEKIGKACAYWYQYGASKRIVVESYGLDGEGTALAAQIVASLANGRLYSNSEFGNKLQSGGFDTGVIISAPPEDEQFASCFADALTNIGKLKEVKVNPARNSGGTVLTGGTTSTGPVNITGSGEQKEAAPLPAGSPVDIMVGIKPIEIATAPEPQ